MFAIGIAFFLSKEPKPEPEPRGVGRINYHSGSLGALTLSDMKGIDTSLYSQNDIPVKKMSMDESVKRFGAGFLHGPVARNIPTADNTLNDGHKTVVRNCADEQTPPFIGFTAPVDNADGVYPLDDSIDSPDELLIDDEPEQEEIKLEVSAGARLQQQVHPDPQSLDYWQDSPAAVLYLNYVDENTAVQILGSGKIDMTKNGEGFLDGVPTGDSPQGQPS